MSVTLDHFHTALRTCTVAVAVLVPVYFFFGSLGMADDLPMQYTFGGEVSRTGSRTEALFSVAFLGVITVGLVVMARFPQTFNYLVEITADNRRRQYRNAAQLVIWLAATFAVIMIVMAGHWLHGLPITLVFVPLAVSGAALVYFVARMFRLR